MEDPSSDTLIVAVRGNGFSLLGADSLSCIGDLKWILCTNEDKTIKLQNNIYMGGAGFLKWIRDLDRSLKKNPYPYKVTSMKGLVRFIVDRINKVLSKDWKDEKRSVILLVVGNLIGKNTHHIFGIHKNEMGTSYEWVEFKDDTVAIGSGATPKIKALLAQFKKTDDVETATRLVFDILRESSLTCAGVGGDLRVITFHKDFAIMSEVEQEDPSDCTSPYTTRTDTIMDPNASHILSVTYRI